MIYLDNSATTKIDPEVLDAMLPYLKEEYGNPSSKYYTLAQNSYKAVEDAREKVAAIINARPQEIVFTSGASESNNFIIKGVLDYSKYYSNRGNKLITSSIEHKSIIQTAKFLAGEVYLNKEKRKSLDIKNNKVNRGFEVVFVNPDTTGHIQPKKVEDSIDDNTALISVMWGNNEVGALNDIHSITELANRKEKLFHSDATQVIGKIAVDVQDVHVDFLSFSAHKLYGPKGIGCAFLRKGKYALPDVSSLIHGGGNQENGYRAGTHAVHDIVGFGKACELAKLNFEKSHQRIQELEKYFISRIKNEKKFISIIGEDGPRVPGIIGLINPKIHNELFIKSISNDIAISSGSACSINEPSYVIDALGLTQYTNNFIRISIPKDATEDDLDALIQRL
jgi:cysteine desulfurase